MCGECFQRHCLHLSTQDRLLWIKISCRSWSAAFCGFKMNFLLIWSAGGNLKFIMQSLFFFFLTKTLADHITRKFIINPARSSRSTTTRNLNSQQSVMSWQWRQCLWKCSPYIQVSDVLCYKLIPLIYRNKLPKSYYFLFSQLNFF